MSDTIKLIAFDYDGTISDSLALIIGSFKAVFSDADLEVPGEDVMKSVIGLPLENCFAVMAPDMDPHAMAAAYRGRQHQIRKGGLTEVLYTGAKEILTELDEAGYFQAVCTAKNLNALELGLNHHEISGLFHSLHTPDHGPSKPAPDGLFQAMNAAGAMPEDTLLIGDSLYDMQMAVNAGVRPVGVSWGYGQDEELRDAGAVAIIDAWSELPAIVEDLIG